MRIHLQNRIMRENTKSLYNHYFKYWLGFYCIDFCVFRASIFFYEICIAPNENCSYMQRRWPFPWSSQNWGIQCFYSQTWKSYFLVLLLLLLSRFSRVWLWETPQTASYQAPLSLGFSRQEHWSGLPCPSPMHESEKWKWSRSVVSNS